MRMAKMRIRCGLYLVLAAVFFFLRPPTLGAYDFTYDGQGALTVTFDDTDPSIFTWSGLALPEPSDLGDVSKLVVKTVGAHRIDPDFLNIFGTFFNMSHLDLSGASLTISGAEDEIPASAMANAPLRSLDLPLGTKRIGDRALYNSAFLEYANLDRLTGLEHIGIRAFGGDNAASGPKLKDIGFEKMTSLKTIGNRAFRYNAFTEVIFPASLSTAGLDQNSSTHFQLAFDNNLDLQKVDMSACLDFITVARTTTANNVIDAVIALMSGYPTLAKGMFSNSPPFGRSSFRQMSV